MLARLHRPSDPLQLPEFISLQQPVVTATPSIKVATAEPARDKVKADVEATTANRAEEVETTRAMIDRVESRFGIKPKHLIGDTYGTAPLLGWLVQDKQIKPHVPVWDKSERQDGSLSRADFIYDAQLDRYQCPAGKHLHTTGQLHADQCFRYRASTYDCQACALKPMCCAHTPARKVSRSVHEAARDVARDLAKTDRYRQSRRSRKKVEILFAHLKRVLKLDRLRLRGRSGARDEFLLAAIAQNLRRLAMWTAGTMDESSVVVI